MEKASVQKEKDLLLAEQAQLQEELAELREVVRSEIDADPDEGDADISEREKDVILIGILERSLADVNKSLRSIEAGSYGICERCNNAIPPERLEAKPNASYCVECQRESERLGKRSAQNYSPSSSSMNDDSWAYDVQPDYIN